MKPLSARLSLLILPLLLAGIIGCSQRNPRTVTTANNSARLSGSLPANPLAWKVITSAIDRSNGTMSMLFGNDIAVEYARSNSSQQFPAGVVLSLVTWRQQEDPRWFGGNIPAQPLSVEFVTVAAAPGNRLTYTYANYQGAPLKQQATTTSTTPQDRAAYARLAKPELAVAV